MAVAHAESAAQPLKAQRIALNLIKADKKALQPRVEMDKDHQARMAASYVDGDEPPPAVHLFFDGKHYWLADGFHRYFAMWSLRHLGRKFQHIRAYVHQGTKDEAIVFAATANLNNRSKDMSNEDRKKAMWMLMDLPEWRAKSPPLFAGKFELSPGAARKYWLEFFVDRGLAIPEQHEAVDGTIRPTKRWTKRSENLPPMRKNREGYYQARIGKKIVHLGICEHAANRKLVDLVSRFDEGRSIYRKSNRVNDILLGYGIQSQDACENGVRDFGIYARSVNGIAVTWESFRDKTSAPAAFGRAMHAKFAIGASRAVVLCPVEDGPKDVMDDYTRAYGVEWMTIEDFIDSLKGEISE